MDTFLRIVGIVFLIIGIVAALIAVWVALKEASKPRQPETLKPQAFNPVDAVKALSSAPLWLALAAVGAGLIVLGSMYDGWRIADGGLTQTPPAATSPTPASSDGS